MSNRLWRSVLALSVVVPAVFASTIAVAADLTVTGFGTIGYARSDQDFQYLRYIDNGGTLKADSLIGLQAEAQFNSQWGATLQTVASAPRTRDDGYEAKIRWAFLSFRPDNEWLFRVGRVRPPFLFNTQNAEVGVTYDQQRLPVEVYSASPIYDFDGGAVTKTWTLDNAEISLDAFWGKSDTTVRLFERDAKQSIFVPGKVRATGMVFSYATSALSLRGGVHQASTKFDQAQPAENLTPTTPFFPVPPPFGGILYVPTNFLPQVENIFLTLGADWRLENWRITTEYVQRFAPDSKVGSLESKNAYVTVARSIAKWTPYVTYARLLSGSETREIYQAVNSAPVPLLAQGAPLFLPTNFHRLLIDQAGWVYDQYSTMLGASYSFSATSKLKFEWMRTKVGLASTLVDGDVHNQRFNVYSVSYSMAF